MTEPELVRHEGGCHRGRVRFTVLAPSFYVPRSHPGGYSVNARCLEPGTVTAMHVRPFDGQRWEQNAGKLAPLPE